MEGQTDEEQEEEVKGIIEEKEAVDKHKQRRRCRRWRSIRRARQR